MDVVVDLGVCLRPWDWSETSQTVVLLGRSWGLLRCLAKGSRRADPRFSGGLESLTLGEMVFLPRSGGTLHTLTTWDLRDPFPALRRSLAAFHAAMVLADVTLHALAEHDPHPPLFDALVESLAALGADEGGNQACVLRYLLTLLDQAGLAPQLHRDVRTGAPLPASRSYGFAPHRGGVTLDPGPRALPSRPDEVVWRVRHDTLHVLRTRGTGPGITLVHLRRANRLLGAYLREMVGRDIPSLPPFLAENHQPPLFRGPPRHRA